MSKYPSTQTILTDADGTDIEGVAKTATYFSTWMSGSDADYIGLVVSASAVSASDTLDITLEYTPNSGASTVSVHGYPSAANSQTQAATAQITAAGDAVVEYWRNIVPTAGSLTSPAFRFKFTLAGASISITLDEAKVILVARTA